MLHPVIILWRTKRTPKLPSHPCLRRQAEVKPKDLGMWMFRFAQHDEEWANPVIQSVAKDP